MKPFLVMILLLASGFGRAQELYIFTEPASNMATGSLGFRLNNFIMPQKQQSRTAYRLDPELMWGINKNWMLHANFYASNMMQSGFKFEGGGLYAKYRFLSIDDIHKHFRMAAFGKAVVVKNPYKMAVTERMSMPDGNGGYMDHYETTHHTTAEQNIDGNHSGWQLGVVATQLVGKLAVSASASSIQRIDNLGKVDQIATSPKASFQGTLSAGYLLFPKNYDNYKQANVNLYAELITQKPYSAPGYFVDAGPGIQFIFNSISRLDLAYRFQLAGDMSRFSDKQLLIRFEYNFLNAINKKS
jgi:hypothetical protein